MNMSDAEMQKIAELVSSIESVRLPTVGLARRQITNPSPLGELNRQQICTALGVSESTIRRLEQAGLPYTPVGVRSKRYDLNECKNWLKENNQCPSGTIKAVGNTSGSWSPGKEFTESCRKVQLRVMPS